MSGDMATWFSIVLSWALVLSMAFNVTILWTVRTTIKTWARMFVTDRETLFTNVLGSTMKGQVIVFTPEGKAMICTPPPGIEIPEND